MTSPRRPIEFGGEPHRVAERLPAPLLTPESVVAELRAICPTSTDDDDRTEHGRDWWPLAMHWALEGFTVTKPSAICRPRNTEEVAAIVTICERNRVAVTTAGGRSGVSGAAIPLRGGVVIDTTDLAGIISIDALSGLVCVRPGTFGPNLENELRQKHGLTVGHFPQSFAISTVGGWVASHGSGQFSTRYGTIADMVAGIEVVSASGAVITFGPHPASSTGPDLMSLFIGSEGTLGVITKIWLRCHPAPEYDSRATFSFTNFNAGVGAMRESIRRGATPAVFRLYDETESARSHGGDGSSCTLLVYDEGDRRIVEATMEVVADSVRHHRGTTHTEDRVAHWLEHRNDTEALQALTRRGYIVDTMEVAASWSALPQVAATVKTAAKTVTGLRVASCHQSHSYLDGGCLYFTFVVEPANPTTASIEQVYVDLWNIVQRAALSAGATVSHHHGVGINRARFLREALGPALDTWRAVKHALDPNDILNPGKLGDDASQTVWP